LGMPMDPLGGLGLRRCSSPAPYRTGMEWKSLIDWKPTVEF